MKKKLIACALVLTLFGCAKDTDFKKKEVKQLVNLISEEERSEIVQMIRRFNSLTEEEKTTVVNVTLDDYSFNHGSSERFDRSIKEPVFTKEALKKRTLHLEKLLDECLDVINVDPNKHKNSVYFYYYEMGRYGEKSERSQLYGRAQPSYLTGRVKQCTDYLYSENYDIGNFEYKIFNFDFKKSKVEKKYALIYLHVKEAGLLRAMDYAYYPKSLLREYANQTGLTRFIHAEERKANKRLEHDQLAATFFGSKELWLKGFYKFLDEKIEKLPLNFLE